jgi:hypothetical protein
MKRSEDWGRVFAFCNSSGGADIAFLAMSAIRHRPQGKLRHECATQGY